MFSPEIGSVTVWESAADHKSLQWKPSTPSPPHASDG